MATTRPRDHLLAPFMDICDVHPSAESSGLYGSSPADPNRGSSDPAAPPVPRSFGLAIAAWTSERPANRSLVLGDQAPLTASPTSWNFSLDDVPMKATAAMITTAISATMSAYSTAVAPPSSAARP